MRKISTTIILLAITLFLWSNNVYASGSVFVMEADGTVWDSAKSLNLFGNDKENLLAPGVEGSYTFTIKNTLGEPASFEMDINENRSLPVMYALKEDSNLWLFGAAEEKITLSPNGQKIMDTLLPQEEKSFTLYWEWEFVQGQDERDTLLGNNDFDSYKISFKFKAEADLGDSTGDDSTGNNQLVAKQHSNGAKTGDDWTGLCRIGLLAGGSFMLIMILCRRRKRLEN